MRKSFYIIIFLTIAGSMVILYQIFDNSLHYDIFSTKNRAAYRIQRNHIIHIKDIDSLKKISLDKLDLSRKYFVEKSQLATKNNTIHLIVLIILIINFILLITFYKKQINATSTKNST